MPEKRKTVSRCVVCGHSIQQDGIGRMRQYCSDACKQEAYRRRRRPAQVYSAEVSHTYLEEKIGRYQAELDFGAATALRELAAAHKITVREDRIAYWQEYTEAGQHALSVLRSF